MYFFIKFPEELFRCEQPRELRHNEGLNPSLGPVPLAHVVIENLFGFIHSSHHRMSRTYTCLVICSTPAGCQGANLAAHPQSPTSAMIKEYGIIGRILFECLNFPPILNLLPLQNSCSFSEFGMSEGDSVVCI